MSNNFAILRMKPSILWMNIESIYPVISWIFKTFANTKLTSVEFFVNKTNGHSHKVSKYWNGKTRHLSQKECDEQNNSSKIGEKHIPHLTHSFLSLSKCASINSAAINLSLRSKWLYIRKFAHNRSNINQVIIKIVESNSWE